VVTAAGAVEADAPPAERRPSPSSPPSARRWIWELPAMVGVAIVVAVVIKTLVGQVFFIPSRSMVPQLEVGDRVVVSKLAYRLHPPHRGDVVVFDAPGGRSPDRSSPPARAVRTVLQAIGLSAQSTKEYIKRVVALPGEHVEAHGGHVYVDGRELVEPYLPPGDDTDDFAPVAVGPGQLFMMGDNRGNSADSRTFGPIPRTSVVGRAMARMWPPGRAAFL
jgi:signal peptidase I